MVLEPVELLVIKFPGTIIRHDVPLALKDLSDHGTIQIIDLLFITKDAQGNVTMAEINDLVSDITGLMSEEDVAELTGTMERNSSVALLLYENSWATRFRDAVANARGHMVMSHAIPPAIVSHMMAARA
jgi:hypothetical protein